MKKLTCIFLVFLLCFSLPAYASETLPWVIDEANLLTETQEQTLTEEIRSLRSDWGMDVVILTVDSLDGQTPQNYADTYYDSHGYASDGLLFLLSMEERDWYISTTGAAIYALTDYGIQQLGDVVVPYLSDGDYAGGFEALLETLPTYFAAYQDGTPVDGYAHYAPGEYSGDRDQVVYYKKGQNYGTTALICLVIGLTVGGIALLIMVFQMNSKRPQPSAGNYLKTGSFHLNQHRDLFLYSQVQRHRKPDPPQSGGGGGSSVHVSSGGSSHGGGGGKF